MIKCQSFVNCYSDAVLYQDVEWKTNTVLLSLIGSEATVKGCVATFLQDKPVIFLIDEEYRNLHKAHENYRCLTRKVAPYIVHCLILPMNFSELYIVGKDEKELREKLLRKVQKEIPFLPEWKEWLWEYAMDTESFTPYKGIGIMGGKVSFDWETLKEAISEKVQGSKFKVQG